MNTVTGTACIQAYNARPSAGESALQYPALGCQVLPATLTCLVGPHRLQLRDYLQMLAGISIANQGKVEIFGQPTSNLDKLSMRKLRSQIGYLSGTAPLLSVQHGLMNVMKIIL